MICERLIEVWLYFFLVGDVGIACFEFVDVKGAAVSVVEFQSSGRNLVVSSLLSQVCCFKPQASFGFNGWFDRRVVWLLLIV